MLLLTLAWGGATLGIAFRLLYPGAPRWLYTPIYIALGWAAVFFLDEFLRYAGTAVVVLIALGGLLYTLGGIVYGLRRPNPIPHLFGFHEVFHGLTVIAFAAHYAGVSIATYSCADAEPHGAAGRPLGRAVGAVRPGLERAVVSGAPRVHVVVVMNNRQVFPTCRRFRGCGAPRFGTFSLRAGGGSLRRSRAMPRTERPPRRGRQP